MPIFLLHGNDQYQKYKKLDQIKQIASIKNKPFYDYSLLSREEKVSKLLTSSNVLPFKEFEEELDFFLLVRDPDFEIKDSVFSFVKQSLNSYLVLYFSKTLRSNSRWLKGVKEFSDSKMIFCKKVPTYKAKKEAFSHVTKLLKKKNKKISKKLLTYVVNELDGDLMWVEGEIQKALILSDEDNSSLIEVDHFKEIFQRPFDKDFSSLLDNIKAKKSKKVLFSLEYIYSRPKYDPTWQLCLYLKKCVLHWVLISELKRKKLPLKEIASKLETTSWFIKRDSDLFKKWQHLELVNLYQVICKVHRHILEKGNAGKEMMYTNLVLATKGLG